MKQLCKHCDGETAPVLRLFNNHLKKNKLDPMWLPHIYLRCVTCGKKQGGALPQTEELRLELDGQTLVPLDYDGMKSERIGYVQSRIPNE